MQVNIPYIDGVGHIDIQCGSLCWGFFYLKQMAWTIWESLFFGWPGLKDKEIDLLTWLTINNPPGVQ